jgi:lipid II:glycine glycyltransferase (peptidoglycan interpeptide bridge formation enzyme)
VRKAQREGVTVRVAHPDDADLDRYEALHAATYARTGAQRHPRAYFAAIWRDFLPNGLAQVFMAERDGQVIAARNFGVYKGAALTWTAAGEDTAGPLGANALLQWEAMRIFAGAGLEWLETGEAFPGAADEKQRGLSAFKASFGGELRPLYRGRLDLRAPWQRRLDALRG